MIFDEFNKAHEKININLIVEDTKAEGLGTTNAIKKLIEVDKVEALVGPTWGDSFQGGYPIATAAKIWTVTPSGAIETVGENKKNYPYLLSTWWLQRQEILTMQNFLVERGYQKVVIVTDKDGFNVEYGNAFANAGKARNLNIIKGESTPIGATDFRTVISKIKAQKPDAVLVLMQDTSQLGPFAKQSKELGLLSADGKAAKILSTASVENQSNLDTFPGLFDGVYYTFPKISESNEYKAYIQKHIDETAGKSAGPSFVNALNAALAITKAIENREAAGGAGMLNVGDVKIPGIGIEKISFDSNGQIEKSEFIIKTITNNKFEIENK